MPARERLGPAGVEHDGAVVGCVGDLVGTECGRRGDDDLYDGGNARVRYLNLTEQPVIAIGADGDVEGLIEAGADGGAAVAVEPAHGGAEAFGAGEGGQEPFGVEVADAVAGGVGDVDIVAGDGDAGGRLLVADAGNDRLRRLNLNPPCDPTKPPDPLPPAGSPSSVWGYWLVGIGLGVGMLGVVLVFLMPKPEPETGALLLETAPPKEKRDRRRRTRRRVAYLGLALLFIGFALQLAGVSVN